MLLDQQHRLEVAARIRQLRETSGPPRLTQPKIADYIGLSLRGYQKAEKTGGIAWEKLEKLGELHGVDPHWILDGEERGDTPDALAALNGKPPNEPADLRVQLDRIETDVRDIKVALGLEGPHDELSAAVEAFADALRAVRRERLEADEAEEDEAGS
jgi:hypothetical protein